MTTKKQLEKYFTLWRPDRNYVWTQYEVQKAKTAFFRELAPLLPLPMEIDPDTVIQTNSLIYQEIHEQGDEWIQKNLWYLCLENDPILHQEIALIFRCLVVNSVKKQINFFVSKCKKYLSYQEQRDLCQELKCLLLYDSGTVLPCTFHYENSSSSEKACFKFDESKSIPLSEVSQVCKPTFLSGTETFGFWLVWLKLLQRWDTLPFSAFVLESYHPFRNFNQNRQNFQDETSQTKKLLKNWTYKKIIQYPQTKDVLKVYGIVICSTLPYLSRLPMRTLINIASLRASKHEATLYQQLLKIIKTLRVSMVGSLTYEMIFERVEQENLAITNVEELKIILNDMRKLVEDYENRIHDVSTEQNNQEDDSSYSLIDRLGLSSQDCFEQIDNYKKKQLLLEIVPHMKNYFVPKYRVSKEIWLRSGIKEAIENRLTYLQNSRSARLREESVIFLPALRLIYCQNMTISQTANYFGLTQPRLSRLVLLTEYENKTRQALIFNCLLNTVYILKEEFSDYIKQCLTQEEQNLINNEPQLLIALIKEELLELATICEQGIREIHSPQLTRTSEFSQLMCSVIQSFAS